jgi:hypothetical protein
VVRGDELYVIHYDEFEVSYVVRLRIERGGGG